jgi:hypothetical protein
MATFYGIYSLLVSVWIFRDAPHFNVSRWWALGALILPLVTPFYFKKTRPSNLSKCIGIWLLGFFIFHVIGVIATHSRIADQPGTSSDQTAQWQTFASEDRKFSIKFPSAPKRHSEFSTSPQGRRIEIVMYESESPDIILGAYYSDFPEDFKNETDVDRILNGARDGAVNNVKGKLIHESVISKGQYQGREINVRTEDDKVILSQFILKENRLYILAAICNSQITCDSQRRAFFDSFAILK